MVNPSSSTANATRRVFRGEMRGVDIVIEATGFFTEREKAAVHIHSGGAKG
ncbi:Uncharacterised protein [Raoultella planticola]|uniref:Uncharacterized protein n=1 Tax=Raoultella planticola TaxID=575 RepID=A0A485AQC2_RAOPL|nr:Uncharacterised protein [Raoultella planticola]